MLLLLLMVSSPHKVENFEGLDDVQHQNKHMYKLTKNAEKTITSIYFII